MSTTTVVTYQMGQGAISLCEAHADGDHTETRAARTAPLGPVQHGGHRGICEACRIATMLAMPEQALRALLESSNDRLAERAMRERGLSV